jgi:hypothetical protein
MRIVRRLLAPLIAAAVLLGIVAAIRWDSNPPTQDYQSRADSLARMSDDECAKIVDHYDFIKPPRDRVTSDGAVFHYDCSQDIAMWYFPGEPEDVWTPRSLFEAVIPAGDVTVAMPIDWGNPPSDRRHPFHSDALTLRELQPEMTVCVHAYGGSSESIVIESLFTEISSYTEGREATLLVGFRQIGGVIVDHGDLMSMGVLPRPFGMWSGTYVTSGLC